MVNHPLYNSGILLTFQETAFDSNMTAICTELSLYLVEHDITLCQPERTFGQLNLPFKEWIAVRGEVVP